MLQSKKGFSLPELLAVMAIMAILAATSSPFIRGYIKDAGNDKAKTLLQMLAQSHKNFKADYPRAGISNASINGSSGTTCTVDSASSTNAPSVLVGCRYIHGINWGAYKYNFFIGGGGTCGDATSLAYMTGTGSGDYNAEYCAWVDKYGTLHDNKNK